MARQELGKPGKGPRLKPRLFLSSMKGPEWPLLPSVFAEDHRVPRRD
jgi:hypothetical protein